jgi:hypothetical protein
VYCCAEAEKGERRREKRRKEKGEKEKRRRKGWEIPLQFFGGVAGEAWRGGK